MKILGKLKIIVCVTIVVLSTTVFAHAYENIIRVGIYYGSGALDVFSAENSGGFSIGYYENRAFNPMQNTKTSVVSVSPNGATWHVVHGISLDAVTAQSMLETLRANGVAAFTARNGSEICVWSGCFVSEEEARASAAALGTQYGVQSANGNSVRVSDKDGRIVFLMNDTNAELGVSALGYENTEETISISGAAKGTYRGGFALKLNDGKLTVVNVLPVEKYLYGVVSREMSASWHVEALKAQAVCARNFALGRINYHKQYGFDVCRTTCCQAYSGTSAEGENVYEAVDGTYGKLLMYNGELCQTVYSSSMGSETENVENVWGSKFPYLVSVENPYEDTENIYNGKWTKKLTIARATEIMNNKGYNIGEVVNITAVEYTPAGRVLKLKVQGTGGEKVFEREMCRSIFSEVTYSQKYTVSKGGITTYPKLNVTNGKQNVSKTMNNFVLSGSTAKVNSAKTIYTTDGNTMKKYETTSTAGNSDEFVFTGEGWGHGVGMSQYGAKGMAEAGFSYDEILTHYYTGTELVNAY